VRGPERRGRPRVLVAGRRDRIPGGERQPVERRPGARRRPPLSPQELHDALASVRHRLKTDFGVAACPGNVLSKEAPDAKEFVGLVRSGLARLRDAENSSLSLDSRFDLAYSAAHALCLAALRHHGYRPFAPGSLTTVPANTRSRLSQSHQCNSSSTQQLPGHAIAGAYQLRGASETDDRSGRSSTSR
jgi:hypothetical protein